MEFFRKGKLCFAVLGLLLPFSKVMAQSYTGLALSQNVITDVFTNPAYVITDNDFQINVFGASGYVGNNGYYLNKDGIGSVLNGVGNPYFSKSSNNYTKAIWGNADFLGPAASFKIKKKYNVAITTRLRYLL